MVSGNGAVDSKILDCCIVGGTKKTSEVILAFHIQVDRVESTVEIAFKLSVSLMAYHSGDWFCFCSEVEVGGEAVVSIYVRTNSFVDIVCECCPISRIINKVWIVFRTTP